MNKKARSIVCILLAVVFIISIVLMVLPIGANAATQSDLNALKEKKAQIAAQKAETAEKISELKAEQADIYEQKAALDEQCELTRQNIEATEEQIEAYKQLIQKEAEELATAETNRDEQLVKYRTRVRAMEENGRYSYIEVLLTASSLSDLLEKIDDVGEIMAADKELEDSYKAAVAECKKLKKQYETAKAEQEEIEEELVVQKGELETQISEASALITSLQASIDEQNDIYNENLEAEEAVLQQMNTLSAQLAAQASASSGSSSTSVNTKGSGQFMWPVPSSSTVSSGYGYRTNPVSGVYKLHAGLDIAASYGAPIVAADSGTVAYVGWDASGYGNYVMINHGNGYTTLYGHMSSVAVSSGQSVSKGQTIGYVGSTGSSTGPHCHFEVRTGGSTINPAQFF